MTAKSENNSKGKTHLLNWLSLVGLYIVIVGLCASVFLFLVELQMDHTNTYLGIVLFMVMPAIIFMGIFMIIGGFLLERRRHRKGGDDTRPQIDLSHGSHRRLLGSGVILGLFFLMISMYGAYRSFHWTESRAFCGEVCHTVMSPEFTAHQNSPHARVECVTCHIGPGPEHFVKSKMRGLYQVYSVWQNKYTTPIPTPLEHLRPAREICEQCHWPNKFFESVLREHVYYLSDEDNTRFNTAMLIHIGGGADEKIGASGVASGIHWHMALSNDIYYIATDEDLQEIPWIKMVDKEGKERIFMDEESEFSEEELLAKFEVHHMDCIDCHNRSVHQFTNPQRLLNSAMLLERIDPSIPYIKQQGLAVLSAEYETQQEGLAAIEEKVRAYYQEEYPEFYADNQPKVKAAILEMQRVFSLNMFPVMEADWRAHPDNIGHMFAKGCFRCHDNKHATEEGETISKDCRLCHDFIAQGFGTEVPEITGPQDYQHPEDIMGLWEDGLCTECHTGAGAQF